MIVTFGVIGAIVLAGCGGGGGSSSTTDTLNVNSTQNAPQNTTQVTTQDTTAPVVTISGESEVSVAQFFLYEEVGATAVDEKDGNLSVDISGAVDTQIPNVYILTYTATDFSGNTGKAERYVTVLPTKEDTNASKIDVLALYSQGADDMYAGEAVARIEHHCAVSNQISNASKAGIKIVLKDITKYAMDDGVTTDVVLPIIQADQNVAQLRETAKADDVFIYRPYANDEMCGLAYMNNDLNPAWAFAHMSIDCTPDVTAHEFGHNLGLSHDHRVETGYAGGYAGRTPYALGHFSTDTFVTIMTYVANYETEKFIMVYSTPTLDCRGEPCGIEAGEVGESDSVRAISEVKQTVSEFY